MWQVMHVEWWCNSAQTPLVFTQFQHTFLSKHSTYIISLTASVAMQLRMSLAIYSE